MGSPGGPSTRPSLRKALVVFNNRTYRFLWASSIFSFLGMQMQMVVRGLLAWELTESFTAVGLVSLSYGIPMLAFSLIGGAVADRVEKRNLAIATQASTGILAVITATLIVTDFMTILLLVVIGLVQGTFQAFGMPARQPLMALVVGPQQLMSAMALSNAAMNGTRLIGPAAAGIIAATFGLGIAYYVQSTFYIASVALLFWVPTGLSANVELSRPRAGMFREIGRGLSYVTTSPRLRLLIIMSFIPAVLAMPHVMLLPGFVQRDLGHGMDAVGVLNSVSGIGALVGSLFIASMTEFPRKPLLQVIAGTLGGVGLVLLGLASVAFGYPGAIAAMILMGLMLTAYQTLNMTMIMGEAEPEYYGRVMSINMLTFSVMPLMAFPLGIVADRIGATNLFMIQGALIIAAMVIVTMVNPRYIFGRFEPIARPAPAGPAGGPPRFAGAAAGAAGGAGYATNGTNGAHAEAPLEGTPRPAPEGQPIPAPGTSPGVAGMTSSIRAGEGAEPQAGHNRNGAA